MSQFNVQKPSTTKFDQCEKFLIKVSEGELCNNIKNQVLSQTHRTAVNMVAVMETRKLNMLMYKDKMVVIFN